MADFRWITVQSSGSIPKWMRSAGVDEDGTVFVPAFVGGDEDFVVLTAGWDGNVPMVIDDGHAYLPARWIAREFPDVAEVCNLIERRCRDHLDKSRTTD